MMVHGIRSGYLRWVATVRNRRGLAIKITREAHAQLKELAAYGARHGWSALDIDRDDPPTQTAMLEEAITILHARMTSSKGRSKR